MNNLKTTRFMTSFFPLLAILVALFASGFQFMRLHNSKKQLSDLQILAENSRRTLEKQKEQGALGKIPAVPGTIQEQNDFLTSLRKQALASGVQIQKWSSAAPTPANVTSTANTMEGISAISSTMEISGEYAKILEFLHSLEITPRLTNLTEIHWSRGTKDSQSRLSCTIKRYVTPPPAEPLPGTEPLPTASNEAETHDHDHGHDHDHPGETR